MDHSQKVGTLGCRVTSLSCRLPRNPALLARDDPFLKLLLLAILQDEFQMWKKASRPKFEDPGKRWHSIRFSPLNQVKSFTCICACSEIFMKTRIWSKQIRSLACKNIGVSFYLVQSCFTNTVNRDTSRSKNAGFTIFSYVEAFG